MIKSSKFLEIRVIDYVKWNLFFYHNFKDTACISCINYGLHVYM